MYHCCCVIIHESDPADSPSEILGVAMCAGVGPAIPAYVGYSPSPADSLCLNQFTLQSVVSDENLWKKIDECEDIVTCSFCVCGDKL